MRPQASVALVVFELLDLLTQLDAPLKVQLLERAVHLELEASHLPPRG